MFTYMSGILSTLEKVFGLRSQYSAYALSGNELSQILMMFVMPFLHRIKRRPLWVGIGKAWNRKFLRLSYIGSISGNAVSVFGCFLIGMAALTTDAFNSQEAVPGALSGTGKVGQDLDPKLKDSLKIEGQLCISNSIQDFPYGGVDGSVRDYRSLTNYPGIALIFLGLFFTGFGNTIYFSLSVSYVDDNIPRLVFYLGTAKDSIWIWLLQEQISPHDSNFNDGQDHWTTNGTRFGLCLFKTIRNSRSYTWVWRGRSKMDRSLVDGHANYR